MVARVLSLFLAAGLVGGSSVAWAQQFKLKATIRCDSESQLNTLDVSRDGSRMILGGLVGVEVWDVSAAKLLTKWHNLMCEAVAISPDGKMVAYPSTRLPEGVTGAAAKDAPLIYGVNQVEVDVDPERATTLTLGGDAKLDNFAALAYSGDGKLLVIGTKKGAIVVYDRGQAKVTASVQYKIEKPALGMQVTVSADGATLASASMGSTLMAWKLPEGKGRALGTSKPCAVSMTADGKVLASLTADGRVETWDLTLDSANGGWSVESEGDLANACAISPDGKLVVAPGGGDELGDEPPRLHAWSTDAKKEIAAPAGGDDQWEPVAVKFSGDGQNLFVGYDVHALGTRDARPIVAVYSVGVGK